MGEALEVAKVLVAPTMKLLDMVGGAIGTMYEPKHKRKMADATAYEINVVGEAMRNAADMPIVYDQNGLAINSEDFSRLMQRAGTRLVLQETIKQHNIESVIDNAYEVLEKEGQCSQEPVEQGWINRFFDSVADISDEDLQRLWGKILAGEIKQPKSYSLRTLETLKNLSKYEAELFQKITPCILTLGESLFLPSDNELLERYGIRYGEIMALDECGLINSSGLISLNPLVSDTKPVAVYNHSKMIMLQGLTTNEEKISIGEFGLTRAGKELFHILDCKFNDEYIYDFAEKTANQNSQKIKVTVHNVNFIDFNGINYESTVLREFPVRNETSTQQELATIS